MPLIMTQELRKATREPVLVPKDETANPKKDDYPRSYSSSYKELGKQKEGTPAENLSAEAGSPTRSFGENSAPCTSTYTPWCSGSCSHAIEGERRHPYLDLTLMELILQGRQVNLPGLMVRRIHKISSNEDLNAKQDLGYGFWMGEIFENLGINISNWTYEQAKDHLGEIEKHQEPPSDKKESRSSTASEGGIGCQ